MNGFKGIQNKEGRSIGTPNKVTAKVRESFATLLENNLVRLQDDIDSLKPAERLNLILQVAKFVIPTLKAIEVQDNGERERTPLVINMAEWK